MSGPSWILATTVVPGAPAYVLATFVDEIGEWFRITPPQPVDFVATGLHLDPVPGCELLATGHEGDAVLATVRTWSPGRGGVLDLTADGTEAEVRVVGDDGRTRLSVHHRGLERLDTDQLDAAYRYGARLWPVWFETHVDPARTTRRGMVPGVVARDVAALLDWLDRTLGLVERGRYVDNGRIQQADVTVGDTELWLDAGLADLPADRPVRTAWTGIWVDDVDAAYERVREAEPSVKPPEDKNYGVRMFNVVDPEGNWWGVMSRIDPGIGDPLSP